MRGWPAGRARYARGGHFVTCVGASPWASRWSAHKSYSRPPGAPSEGIYASRSDRRPRRAPARQRTSCEKNRSLGREEHLIFWLQWLRPGRKDGLRVAELGGRSENSLHSPLRFLKLHTKSRIQKCFFLTKPRHPFFWQPRFSPLTRPPNPQAPRSMVLRARTRRLRRWRTSRSVRLRVRA
jgi:hypothetical protein